ncbi:MAG TPA: MMPL family transporter [Verrucomicrobiae bacterium]|nr:MMPL family transporter [Verrucomicrobiae bacterium]
MRLLRWLPLLSLAVAGALAALVTLWVDLKPRVDERFFFANDSKVFRESAALGRRFSSRQLLVVTAHGDDIDSADYIRRIKGLTEKLERLERVDGVTSLAKGPDDVKDAKASPLWRRLLLLDNLPASNLVLVVDDSDSRALIESVTRVMRASEAPGFRLTLAGVPYVVDEIARNLKDDFKSFSIAAVVVFSALILALFRSFAVLLGSLAACAVAACGALVVQQLMGGRIGLLTANLITIAFVLTQSHIVFLTNNWRQLRRAEPAGANAVATVRKALGHTLTASGWCMVTALLGFASLMFVEAQPLRELGQGGLLATLAAMFAAYLMFPPFLLWARPPPLRQAAEPGGLKLVRVPPAWAAALVLAVALALGTGAVRLNSDPSLLAYFEKGSAVHESLAAIDPHGGSNPLSLSVRRLDGARLDTEESYKRMWALQRDWQEDRAVGTVLSLPVLMAEAARSPLASLLSWNWLLDLLSRPRFDRVARSFVTDDRLEALYLLRMQEAGREERRTHVIARLRVIAENHGFRVSGVGGTYALQGRLADLVTHSLYEGLVGLLLSVFAIAWVVTRSLSAALLMLLCTATVPAVALGIFGYGRIPLDIIATPGVNVAIGVAVDSMIHFGAAWRRERAARPGLQALARAQQSQAGGIIAFSLVVLAGFAIFAASSFPPTQRFGLSVILGAATAGAMALWVLPGVLQWIDHPARSRRR